MSNKTYGELELVKMLAERALLDRRIKNMEESAPKCTCGQTREMGELPNGVGEFDSRYKLCEVHKVPRWKVKLGIDRARELLAGVGVTVEEALKNFDVNIKALNSLASDSPPLIQGYTAEQWQEIIDGGYLCEFSLVPFESNGHVRIGTLSGFHKEGYFRLKRPVTGDAWQHCRPAQIKGVMRPIFVEPVKDCKVVYFDEKNEPLSDRRYWVSSEIMRSIATKYIEL